MTADATYFSGDTKSIQVTIINGAGAAVNLAGATIVYVLVSIRTGATVLTKTAANGISIGGASNNVVTIAMAPADTAVLDGVYRHELQITDSSGNVSTALQGLLTLLKDYA